MWAASWSVVDIPVAGTSEATARRMPWARLLTFRQVWGLVVAKFLTDAAWFFYISWLPKYLYDARHFDVKQVGAYAWVPYAASGVGCLLARKDKLALLGMIYILRSLAQRYMTSSDRFSNLLFVGVSEFLAPRNVQIVPVAMIVLFTAALIWLVYEIKRLLGLQWSLLVDILIGGLLAFFPIFEAPNRFQTIYWRSGMATHFAPLVYLTAFSALLLMLIRRNSGRAPAIWIR